MKELTRTLAITLVTTIASHYLIKYLDKKKVLPKAN